MPSEKERVGYFELDGLACMGDGFVDTERGRLR